MNMMNRVVKGSFLVLIFVFIMSCFSQTNALIDDFVHVKHNGIIDEEERFSQK
jgi:hypothetical protein